MTLTLTMTLHDALWKDSTSPEGKFYRGMVLMDGAGRSWVQFNFAAMRGNTYNDVNWVHGNVTKLAGPLSETEANNLFIKRINEKRSEGYARHEELRQGMVPPSKMVRAIREYDNPEAATPVAPADPPPKGFQKGFAIETFNAQLADLMATARGGDLAGAVAKHKAMAEQHSDLVEAAAAAEANLQLARRFLTSALQS